jgi:hypothetical protein
VGEGHRVLISWAVVLSFLVKRPQYWECFSGMKQNREQLLPFLISTFRRLSLAARTIQIRYRTQDEMAVSESLQTVSVSSYDPSTYTLV